MTTKAADDMPSIAQRLKEIEAEKAARINGISLEDAKPTETPADVDWTGMYGYPCGYTVNGGTAGGNLSSLAHPGWPYAGTGHEWRKFVK
jgi:hypothetical protein